MCTSSIQSITLKLYVGNSHDFSGNFEHKLVNTFQTASNSACLCVCVYNSVFLYVNTS